MTCGNYFSIRRLGFVCTAMLLAFICVRSADCQTLFGYSSTGSFNDVTANLASFDAATGAGTIVGEIGSGQGFSPDGLAFDPATQALFGNVGNQLFSIDPTTGNATDLGTIEFNTGLSLQLVSLAFDTSTNALLGFGTNSNNLLTIDPGTLSSNPVATPIGPTGLGSITGLTFDSSGTLFG